MDISIIGAGYVGLITAACLAEKGNCVINCDIDEKRINMLNNGEIPVYEPGLEDIITMQMATDGVNTPNLRFSSNIAESVKQSELVYVAVGTPSNGETVDLTYLWEAVSTIARTVNDKKIVAIKSTVPPGTSDKLQRYFNTLDKKVIVVSNPEFLVEGKAVESTKKPDRILVGTNHLGDAKPVFDELYNPFVVREGSLMYMSPIEAELSKVGANAMLAARISMINEIAMLAERLGADILKVRRGIGSDKRIGLQYLFAGPGFGGSCFPKDVPMLAKLMQENDVMPYMLKATIDRNKVQKKVLPYKIIKRFCDKEGRLDEKVFGLWGLAFKADTDDIRESPALDVVEELTKRGAVIQAYDPKAGKNASEYFNELIKSERLKIVDNMYQAIEGVDGLAIATEWDSFKSPNFGRMLERMRTPTIFDGRNLFDPRIVKENYFEYYPIGRPAIAAEK